MSRLGFTYFMSDEAVDYIIKAVAMVARHGWKLLPQVCVFLYQLSILLSLIHTPSQYTLNPETGLFSHKDQSQDRRCLSSISYQDGHMTYKKTIYQPAPSFEVSITCITRTCKLHLCVTQETVIIVVFYYCMRRSSFILHR